MTKIKPCPFCHEKEDFSINDGWGVCVKCNNCLATGPLMGSKKLAIIMWNRASGEESPKICKKCGGTCGKDDEICADCLGKLIDNVHAKLT